MCAVRGYATDFARADLVIENGKIIKERLDEAQTRVIIVDGQVLKDGDSYPVSKRDPVVDAVRSDLLGRSQLGIVKYGVTLERNDLSLRDWLQHAYEETLDQANYLKRAILEIDAMLPAPTA